MENYSFYLLWLPKYFDKYYDINQKNEAIENHFLYNLKEFLKSHKYIENCKLKIYDKNISNMENSKDIISFYKEENSIGYWGKIEFEVKNGKKRGQIVFNEFGFYYFEFINPKNITPKSIKDDREIIKSFFCKKNNYPLLTDNQEDVLKETFLNDHLDYRDFNRKYSDIEKKIKLEDFILESLYTANESDIDGKTIQNKISKLQEYKYQVKRDEYYDFQTLNEDNRLQPLRDKIINIFKGVKSPYSIDGNIYKRLPKFKSKVQFLKTIILRVVN